MKLKTAIILLVLILTGGMFGCKKVYMVPSETGWVEMEIKEGGDEIKYKPAEKIEVEYE